MSRSEQKIVQYLKEARASELALVRVLQSQIAMTPRGTLRSGLEAHLEETREHAKATGSRARELSHGFNPVALAFGLTEAVVGQALALSKTPLDLVRGTGGEEKVLKNAKDSAAAEALEIATYTALERLAELAGDTTTAELAARIRGEEERMLDRLLAIIPELTDAVYAADVGGNPSYDPTTTGAADVVRGAAGAAKDAAAKARTEAKDTAAKAKAEAKDTAAKAKAGAEDTAAKAKAGAEDAAAKAKAGAEDAAAKAKDAVEDGRETASEVADAATTKAEEATDAATSKARDAAADVAGAAGTAARRVEDAADQAKSAAEDVQERAEDAEEELSSDDDTASEDARPVADAGTPAPWASYDESSTEEILAVLLTADDATLVEVGAYERAHQARKGVLSTVDRRTPAA